MPEPRAQRTLVKSPPELWAEVSDPASLTRHLGELGPIRITRLDPETTVAWEGDRVRGTVELEASGWGTRVTLKAEGTAPGPALPAPGEEVAAPVAAPARAAAPLAAAEVDASGWRRTGLLARFRRRSRPEAAPPTAPTTAPPATAPGPAAAEVEAMLVGVLDELGSASRRPFSR